MSFVVRGNGPTIFFCGRSGYCESFYTVGEEHHPDLAILPIGGYLPASFRDRHLSPLDALYAFEDLRARLLVPIHFGSFALSYERLGEPPRWLADLVSERDLQDFVVPLAHGESRLFTNPARAKRPTPHQHIDDAGLILGPAGRSELAG
jgi:L-ascorbate metabolism protein UlaG (beta-lactamase superfamily)